MKTKRGFLSLQVVIIAAVIVLNCLMFYMMHCSGEYLQSTDVWGNTQTVSHSGFRSRLGMLKAIPSDISLALERAEQTIARIEAAEDKVEESRGKVERVQKESQAELDALLSSVGNKEDYEALAELLTGVLSFESEMVELGEKAHGMSQTALFNEGWYFNTLQKPNGITMAWSMLPLARCRTMPGMRLSILQCPMCWRQAWSLLQRCCYFTF